MKTSEQQQEYQYKLVLLGTSGKSQWSILAERNSLAAALYLEHISSPRPAATFSFVTTAWLPSRLGC